jgi:prepilin-type processing-associated H-X9-DG protein
VSYQTCEVPIIAILAAILFPVFAQARDKARQAACLSNLKQVGTALQMYSQDYDERLPATCSWGRRWAWINKQLNGPCKQDGITAATPNTTYLGPVQTPVRYIQEMLHPYAKNEQLWFCPSVGRDRTSTGPGGATFGFNGTTYIWNHSTNSPPKGAGVTVSGLAVAAVPRPAEAPVLWDMPYWYVPGRDCPELDDKSAHALGLNVVYADGHAKYDAFRNASNLKYGKCNYEDWWANNSWRGFVEGQ